MSNISHQMSDHYFKKNIAEDNIKNLDLKMWMKQEFISFY